MIKNLSLENFKTWKKADVGFGRITGLFGTNSSGKSSIIQFLLLLKQTKDASDRGLVLDLNGRFVTLGTFADAVHRHDLTAVMKYSVDFELDYPLEIQNPMEKTSNLLVQARNLGLSAIIDNLESDPRAKSIEYSAGERRFSLSHKGDGDKGGFELRSSGGDPEFTFVRTQGRPWNIPGPIKSYAFPDKARTFHQNSGFLADLEAAYEGELDKIFYLGPLREHPKRDYLWARSRPTDVGDRGEKAIDAILSATERKERRNIKWKGAQKPFQEIVAYWLSEMNLISEFRVKEIAKGSNRFQAIVKTRPNGSEVFLTDVGFGVSQVLPVVTLLQYVPEGSTVILEQPEIHLHPLAQATLADVIINAAFHRGVQIIVESHAEHLLLRLQRRIAEGSVPSEEVKLYFCDAPDGASRISPLELDIFGNIKNWPDKFMGDAFNESAEAEIARLKRMQESRT